MGKHSETHARGSSPSNNSNFSLPKLILKVKVSFGTVFNFLKSSKG